MGILGVGVFRLLILASLSIWVLPSLAAQSRTSAKPAEVVKWIGQGEIPTTPEIDWGPYTENMRELGFAPEAISQRIASLKAGHYSGVFQVRHVLTAPDWLWSDGLSREQLDQLCKIPHLTHQIFEQLGLWAGVKGFNPTHCIKKWLSDSGPVSDDYLLGLMAWSHLWLKSRSERSIAQYIWKLWPSYWVAGWLLRHLTEKGRDRVAETTLQSTDVETEGDPTDLLTMASHLPANAQPPSLRRRFLRGWYNPKKFPPIVLDEIRTILHGSHHAGTCQNMSHGHLETLGVGPKEEPLADLRNTILIRVQGHLVGALKMVGDKSMIALRNVVNSNGDTTLCFGGVYLLPLALVERLSAIPRHIENEWTGIDLADLAVKPSTFLLNENAWNTINRQTLLRLAKQSTKGKQAKTIERAFDTDSMESTEILTKRIRSKIWPELLQELDCIRSLLERS